MDFFHTGDMFGGMTQLDDKGSETFSRVIDGVLRPLVRALIARGVTAPAFYRRLKRLYVEVAEEELRAEADRPTDSRISILTGVHRRDVKTFREDGAAGPPGGEKVTTMALVLGTWLARNDLTDAEGRPIPLPRTAEDGPSFDALVAGISRDIRPRTVLDELLRQGLAEIDAGGRVALMPDTVFGPEDLEQRLRFFGTNVGDHIAAAVDNLLAEDPPHMERAVFYNRLTPASVDRLEAAARDEGMRALIAVNRLANDLQAQDLDAPEGTERFRFGLFFFRDDEAPAPPGQSQEPPAVSAEGAGDVTDDDT
ncbi:MAG: DUF6502 family protein [Pseudomonadota bacterium]